MFITFIAFFAVLAVLILVHELGHFLAARKHKVGVEEFGFGFPPRLASFKKGETLYSFNLLPLGGFVKITGEDASQSDNPKNFASRSIAQRASILVAGVFFNLILAYFLFSFVVWIGMPVNANDPLWQGRVSDPQIMVIDVFKGSSAAAAGIETGDKIVAMRPESGAELLPSTINQMQDFTKIHRGENVGVVVLRDGDELRLSAFLPENNELNQGILGIAMANIGTFQQPWYSALWSGLEMTIATFARTMKGLAILIGMLVSGEQVAGLVSGPVGIFSIVASSIDFGIPFLIVLIATLSVNLAFINLIPFPGLDGGRLLFLAIEGLRGRPISQKIGGLAHAIGFVILILLMVVITYYDFKLHL